MDVIARIRSHQAMAAFRRAPRRGRMPRQEFPHAIEADYAARLVAIVHIVQPAVDHAIALYSRSDGMRLDAGELHRITALFAVARQHLEQAMRPAALDVLARRYAHAATAFQKAQLARQIQAAIGIDIMTGDAKLPHMVDAFAHENAALIRKLGHATLSDVETVIARAFSTGRRAESVASDLAARMGVHERHARLIARDQIGTLTGQVNGARQQDLGIDAFTWRSVNDERVRPEHAHLNGQVFRYAKLPSEGLPGTPVLCRCSAEPVFDSLLAAVDA